MGYFLLVHKVSKRDFSYVVSHLDLTHLLNADEHFWHDKLDVKTINKHGLLYRWQGLDPQLKPLLFMAHSDVNIFSPGFND